MEAKKPKKRKFRSAVRELYDWTESILIALLMVIVVLTFAVRGTVVDGDSMFPTLEDSQFLALARVYGALDAIAPLKHNDIVVLYAKDLYDENDGSYGKPIIKRVIGMPGDLISIDTYEGVVYRNGEPLETEYIDGILYEDGHVINDYTRDVHNMREGVTLQVPEHHIFVLGDNRNISVDSRSSSVGMVDMNYIIGRVLFRITPFEHFGIVK